MIINVIPMIGTPPNPDPSTEAKTQLITVIIRPRQKTSLVKSWVRNCISIDSGAGSVRSRPYPNGKKDFSLRSK
jgi:hypothetical protein